MRFSPLSPDWVCQALDDLAQAGIFTYEGEGFSGGKVTRGEAARLVARAVAAVEAGEGVRFSQGGAYEDALRKVGSATRLLARLEALEARAPQEVEQYELEYVAANRDLESLAKALAEAELDAQGTPRLEKAEKDYRAALDRLGSVSLKLAQARQESGREEQIRQLRAEKEAALKELQAGSAAVQPSKLVSAAQRGTVERLKDEFAAELADMGYGAVRVAQAKPAAMEADSPYKVSGELRYSYAQGEGPRAAIGDDSRLRLRLYGEAALSRDWSAYAMVEADKHFMTQGRGSLDWDRLYLKGKAGKAELTAGRFGYMIAEGNIYDSTFKGAVAEFGDPVRIRAGWGRTSVHGDGALASASYKAADYNVEGGFYRYEDRWNDDKNTIAYLGGNYFLGKFSLGAMYLRGSFEDRRGDRDGYVLTLGYGELKTWKPGAHSFFVKYYDQAQATYVAHTMNGPAGYMEGFKGFGAGVYYTLAENLLYGLEYYNLEDKNSAAKGRTLWNQISYYF